MSYGSMCPYCWRCIPWAPEPSEFELRFPAICAHVDKSGFSCEMFTRTFTEEEKRWNMDSMDLR